MASNPLDEMAPQSDVIGAKRAHTKFGLGVGLTSLAVVLFLASFVLIWLGVFPGLIAIALAIPLAITGVRFIRGGEPATTTER